MSDNSIKRLFGYLSGIICLVVYLITLSPTVSFVDSGELAAATYTFGIPHPTGYPLYLILGYFITHLPFGASPVWRLNLFSAIASAIAVIIFYYSILCFLKNFNIEKYIPRGKDKKKLSEIITPLNIYIIAFATSLCFGFTRNFWSNAIIDEVYGLHALFICLVLYYSMRIYINLKLNPLWLWSLLFIFLGLSFTNHLTMVFLVPSILYLIYLQYRVSPASLKRIIYRSFLILPPLLIYSVLMIAATYEPFVNWSNPTTIKLLIHHLSGGDFSHLFMQSGGVFSKNLKLFGDIFISQYAIISTVVLIIGYVLLFKRNKELFIYFTLLNLTCLIFGLNYNVIDVENYFILLFISMGFTLSLGILEILIFIKKKFNLKSISLQLVGIVCIIFVVSGFINNYSYNDNSKLYISEDITLQTIKNLDSNAIIVCYDWATLYNTALYYQQVENIRPDVKVILIRLFAAPWYLNILKKFYPELYNSISNEAEEYISYYGTEPVILAPRLIHLVKSFFHKNLGKYPVYITYDMFYNRDIPDLFKNYGWKPGSLCYQLTYKNEPYDDKAGTEMFKLKLRPFDDQSMIKRNAKISTAGMYYDFAFYHYKNGNKELAIKFLDKSLEVVNNFTDAMKLKSKILSEKDTLKEVK